MIYKTIRIFSYQGEPLGEQLLTLHNLQSYLGMMARCYMRNGSYTDGFITFTPDDTPKDYGPAFFLWTWANLDETTHQLVGDGDSKYKQNYIKIKDYRDLERVDVILFSNPRRGGRLYNHFFIDDIKSKSLSLSFKEVDHIFKTIWISNYAEYWYQTVWKILEKHGLTKYRNEIERYDVLFRAVAVSMIYEDFCNVYCEEPASYDYLDEFDLSSIALGQLYGIKHKNEIIDIEDECEIICTLADEFRKEIVTAIKKEILDMEIFAQLACTVHSVTVTEEYEDENGKIYEEEEEFFIESMDDYKKTVDIFMNSDFNSPEMDDCSAFSWIESGMPRTGSY